MKKRKRFFLQLVGLPYFCHSPRSDGKRTSSNQQKLGVMTHFTFYTFHFKFYIISSPTESFRKKQVRKGLQPVKYLTFKNHIVVTEMTQWLQQHTFNRYPYRTRLFRLRVASHQSFVLLRVYQYIQIEYSQKLCFFNFVI